MSVVGHYDTQARRIVLVPKVFQRECPLRGKKQETRPAEQARAVSPVGGAVRPLLSPPLHAGRMPAGDRSDGGAARVLSARALGARPGTRARQRRLGAATSLPLEQRRNVRIRIDRL